MTPQEMDRLLTLAVNADETTSDTKPDGLRMGDIVSNGWAGNRNPLKLFMFLRMGRGRFVGVSLDGKECGPETKDNRVRLVLSRDTPDLWKTWEILAHKLVEVRS